MSQGPHEYEGAPHVRATISELFFPAYLRWMFPFYLFFLPKSAAEYRDKCVHLSWFCIVITALLAATFGSVLLVVAGHSFRFDFAFSLLSLVFSLSARARIMRTNRLDSVGLLVLACATYIPLGAHLPKYFDFYSSGEFLLLTAIATGDAFLIFVLTRFFIRGIELLPRKRVG